MDEKNDPENENNDEEENFQLDEENDEYQFAEEAEAFNFEDEDFQFSADDDDDFDMDEGETSELVQNINRLIEKVKSGEVKELVLPIFFVLVAIGVIGFGFTKLAGIISGGSQSPQFAQSTTAESATGTTTPSPTAAKTTTAEKTPAEKSKPTSVTKKATMSTDVQSHLMNQQAEFMKKIQSMEAQLEQRLQTLESQSSSLNEKISNIEKQSAQNTSQINTLSRGVGNVQTQVADLNNTITSLLAAVKKRATQVAQPSSRPAELYPARTPSRTPVSSRDSGSKASYVSGATPERFKQSDKLSFFVQAIIPGRAWLKDNENRIVSIGEGDTVPGYGKVVAIDPRNGFVTMSSGTKFEYGIEQF